MSTVFTSLQVARAPLTPDSQALQLALRAWSAEDREAMLRNVTETQHATTSPLVLVEARRGTVLAGAVLGQCVPGKAAIVWPPQLVEPQPLVTTSSLLDELCRELVERDVAIAQSLLQVDALLDAEHLQAGGFTLLADLLYLQTTSDQFPTEAPETPFELFPIGYGEEYRLVEAVNRTYVGTMDCPKLDGCRSTEDVVDGYRAIGVYRPELWLVAVHEGHDIGCLIMADHPQQGNLELVYMGLSPEVRGRGFGLPLVRWAQWHARQAGRERLVLAVDAANRPAVRLYDSAGFRALDQRCVWWKQLRTGT